MVYSEETLKRFIQNNYEHCLGLCQSWGLEIKTDEEMYQAAEYLLNQI